MTLRSNAPYPGMLSGSGIEFFAVEGEVHVIEDSVVKEFEQLSYYHLEILRAYVRSHPELAAELAEIHPNSEMLQLKQLAHCRFGGLDHQPDVKDGLLQEGEYHFCPLRGNCKSEGVLCKSPTYNGASINPKNILLMQLLSSSMTNEAIAAELEVPMGTLNKMKKELYELLGFVQTKQEVAIIARELNII